jgi:hypothetical protein
MTARNATQRLQELEGEIADEDFASFLDLINPVCPRFVGQMAMLARKGECEGITLDQIGDGVLQTKVGRFIEALIRAYLLGRLRGVREAHGPSKSPGIH